jgi:DNA modification methylase
MAARITSADLQRVPGLADAERCELDGGRIVLINGDCLQVLPTLEPGSVDAVVTDPPYGVDFAGPDGSCTCKPAPKPKSDRKAGAK